jgi:hypothetical protein
VGYTTEFAGAFNLDKPLSAVQVAYLRAFCTSRRMQRDAKITATLPDPLRERVGLPVGVEGGYYVGAAELDRGQARTLDIIGYNTPPSGQPGLWCKWALTGDGAAIRWSGAEKFYHYVEWLKYLIEHFLAPWGYVLSGEVTWQGEEPADTGKIIVENNVVTTKAGHMVYE